MKDTRIQRISSEVKKVISQIIANDLKNPHISEMTSITEVRVSKDLMYADIYVSIFGSEKKKQETMEALEDSKGYLRNLLGKKLKLRLTPEPRFHLDQSIEIGVKMSQLINETIQADKEKGKNE